MLRAGKGTTLAAAIAAVALLGACGRGRERAAESTAAMPGSTTAATPAMPAAPAAPAVMSDAEIFAVLHEVNQGEVDAGKIAESKATNAEVKTFAREMVASHTKMLKDGDALAKRLNVTPTPPPNDSVAASNSAMKSALQSAAKGSVFDSTYINGEVRGHEHALALLKSIEGKAQAAQLNDLVRGAVPAVQAHLDRAKAIQGKVK